MLWWEAQLFWHTNNLHSAGAEEANRLSLLPAKLILKFSYKIDCILSIISSLCSRPLRPRSLMVLGVSYSTFLLGYFKRDIGEWVLSTDSTAHRMTLTWQAAFLAHKVEVKISLWSSLLVFCSLHRSPAVGIILVAWNKTSFFWFWIKTIIP